MINMKGALGQKFHDEFCEKCEHWDYVDGKKVFDSQIKVCMRPDGECKELMNAVMKKAVEVEE